MELQPGLHIGLLCDPLSSCGLLSCSKLRNLTREICRISPYVFTWWFPHVLMSCVFSWGAVCMLNAAPGSKQLCQPQKGFNVTFPLFCIF